MRGRVPDPGTLPPAGESSIVGSSMFAAGVQTDAAATSRARRVAVQTATPARTVNGRNQASAIGLVVSSHAQEVGVERVA